MDIVLFHPGIGAPNDPGNPPYAAVDDVVVQRGIGGPEGSTEHVIDVFMGKSVYAGVDNLGNFDRHTAVLKAADGLDDDLIGAALGVVFVKLNMGGAFYVAARVGGNQRCLVA